MAWFAQESESARTTIASRVSGHTDVDSLAPDLTITSWSDSTVVSKQLLMHRATTKMRKQMRGYDGDLESLGGPFGVDDSCFPPLGGPPTSRLNFSANTNTLFSKFSNRTLSSIDR